MRRKKKFFISIVLMLALVILQGCNDNMKYIVRYDIEKSEIEYLYKEMPDIEVFSIFGLPHKSTIYIDSTIQDYFIGESILRLECHSNKLSEATFFEKTQVGAVALSETNIEVDYGNKYYQKVKHDIEVNEIDFINDKTTAEDVQKVLGPPHEVLEYQVVDGTVVNSYVYRVNNGNRLRIVYMYTGIVYGVAIENTDGEVLEVIVELLT